MVSTYSITQLLLLSAILVSGYLIVVTWRNQRAPQVVGLWFTRLIFALSGWSLAYMLELAEPRLPMKQFWSSLKFVGVAITPVTWFLFCAFSTGQDKSFTRRRRWLLMIIPILTSIIVFTNPLHHLFWQSVTMAESGDMLILRTEFGLWFWVHGLYSYILLLAGVVLLVRHLRRAPTLTRGRFVVLMIGLAVPWVANIITLAGVLDVDLTPLGFVVTAVALAFGMLRLHLLNIAPIARDALFDQMTDAILILDKQGQVVDFNIASQRVLQPQSGLGLPIQATLPKLTYAADWIEEARHSRFAMHEWLADANTVYDVRVSTLQDRNDQWVGYLFTLRDITAQKRAEDRIVMQNSELQKTNTDLALARTKAEESSRLKSEFLAVMSHELRTPLNAIMGFTELQMMGATGQLSDSQKDFLNRTLASSHELLELINNVIDLTRLEAERLPIRREPFETRGWWVKAIDMGHKQSAKKGLNFETEIDPNLPTILIGDAERLQQILMILLSNALKFTDEGAISVWMRYRDAQWWELGVQDTGIGVPTALQSAIFEAFRQVDSSSRRKYGGMGLGLALAQRLVQALGGRIEIESRENVGSTFRVILPMLAEPIIEQPSDN